MHLFGTYFDCESLLIGTSRYVFVGGQLEPFQRLFSTIMKWQKAEKKIMDGTFLELNAEKTQAEVCVCVCVRVRV